MHCAIYLSVYLSYLSVCMPIYPSQTLSYLINTEDVVVHEFATLILAHLSVDITCKVEIFHHGGLEPLLHLLSSPDPDVQKNSVECVYNLVQVRQRNSYHFSLTLKISVMLQRL